MSEIRRSGSVKWFDDHRGFGFIVPDEPIPDLQGDLFVHVRNVMPGTPALCEGLQVEFLVSEGRGRHAGRLQATAVALPH